MKNIFLFIKCFLNIPIKTAIAIKIKNIICCAFKTRNRSEAKIDRAALISVSWFFLETWINIGMGKYSLLPNSNMSRMRL